MRKLLLFGLLLLLPALGAAADWPSGVPQQPADPVTDLAGMLSPGTVDRLNAGLRAQWQAGRFQMAVLTLPSLEGRAIEDVSIQIARSWALGSKEGGNGVLLLIAAKDHKLRFEVGSRIEGELTDIASHRIIAEEMTPRLRQGDADGAVLAGVAAATGLLAPEDPLAAAAPPARPSHSATGLAAILIFLFSNPIVLIIVLVVINILLRSLLGVSGGRGGGWGGGGWGGGSSGGGWGGSSGGGFSGGGGGFSGGGSSGSW